MIVVNPTTRQFNIPGADLVFGVTDDAGSEVKHFQCPRYVGNNLDIASSFVRINYRNANGGIDSHLISEVTTVGDNVTFSWELHPNVTMYKGNITFVMCVVGPDTKVKWHTTLGRGQVLEGLEPDNAVIEADTKDVIAQLISMVEAQSEAVEQTGADQMEVVKAAAKTAQDSAVAEIEAKRVNSLNSIPEDYTAMQNAVDSLTRGRAGAIVCEVEGSAVAVKDASNMALQGLRIFGRSTQDGTPTPESPVEIKSVEGSAVDVHGKNLFPVYPRATTRGVTLTQEPGGWIVLNGTATSDVAISADVNIPVGTYFFAANNDIGVGETFADSPYMAFRNENRGWVTSNPFARANYSRKVEVTERVTSILLAVPAGLTLNNWRARFHLEVGEIGTEFEENKPTQTVETTHPLRGIPVTSGGNYTDENGQQWICDEVDLERGVYVQRIYEQTILANKITTIDTSFLEFGAYCSVISDVPMLVDTRIKLTMSDFALGVPTDDRNRPEYTPWYRTYHSGGSGFVIRYPASVGMKTIEEARVDFAGKKIRYVLATPIEIPLSETEIAAYHALHSNYPNTTVLNDSGAHMSVKYAADTKLYIDNKLAALVGNT